jgi:hypothetical protein
VQGVKPPSASIVGQITGATIAVQSSTGTVTGSGAIYSAAPAIVNTVDGKVYNSAPREVKLYVEVDRRRWLQPPLLTVNST